MIATIFPELHSLSAMLSDVVGGSGHKTQSRYGIELHLKLPREPSGELLGLGEASPIPGFSVDTLDRVTATLSGLEPFEVTLPEDPRACGPLIAELAAQIPENEPSARFAFESALLDLFSRHLGCSAATLLAEIANQRRPGTVHQPREKLGLSRLLPLHDLTECLAMARHAWLRGYRVFKLKIGRDAELASGFAAIRALRERFGKEIELRIDPNGAWPEENVADLLAQLTEFEPELVEEPCPFASLLKLSESPVPLALDESLIDPAALSAVIPHRERLKLRAIVVKPALLGLLRALELCLAAEEVGLDVVVTHLFDGPVGHASAMSLALALGSRDRAHGLAPHPGLLLSPNRRIRGLGQGLLLHEAEPGLPLTEVKPC